MIISLIDQELFDNDTITISYSGALLKSTDGTSLQNFTDLTVKNNLPFHFPIPTKIEAEDYVVNNGLQLETTTDIGGGKNIGYTNAGDYLEYRIYVSEEGNYPLAARIACNATAGKIEMEQRTVAGEILNSVVIDVPVTGGWQSWQTVNTIMKLDAGHGVLRAKILQPEFNINWFQFSNVEIISAVEEDSQHRLIFYPNPGYEYLTIEIPENYQQTENSIRIRSLNGKTSYRLQTNQQEAFTTVPIFTLPSGMYFIELHTPDKVWRTKFIKLK